MHGKAKRFVITDHGIKDGQQLAHTGHQRQLLGLSCGQQACVELLDNRIVFGGNQGGHVNAGAQAGPAALDGPFALKAPRVMWTMGSCGPWGQVLQSCICMIARPDPIDLPGLDHWPARPVNETPNPKHSPLRHE